MDDINKMLVAIEKGIDEIKKNMATKGEIIDLKDGMKALESRLVEKIEEAQMEIIETVDKHKADKEDVKVLEKRVERLEENAGLSPHLD